MTTDRDPAKSASSESELIAPMSNLEYARPTATRKPSAGDWILAAFGLVGALPFVFLGAGLVGEIYRRGAFDGRTLEMGMYCLFAFAVGGLGVWNAVRIVRRRKLAFTPE